MSQDESRTTIVAYSDLLGFGSMISNAGGTFDFLVGKVAKARIVELRKALAQCENLFPAGTKFFHLIDLVLASLDVQVFIDSMLVNAETIHSKPLARTE